MLIDDFIQYLRSEKRYSPHTASAYGRDIRTFIDDTCPADRPFDPEIVSTDDVRQWIVSLSVRGLSAASINRMTSSVRAFFRWLRMKGHVANDPTKHTGNLKTPSRLPDYIPESQVASVAVQPKHPGTDSPEQEYIYRRDGLIVLLLYSTGIRLAELCGIRLSDFSHDMSTLRVTGKGGKERIVPVVEYTRGEVKDFIRQFNTAEICLTPEKNLFLSRKGVPLSRSSIYNAVKRQLSLAGIQGKKSPHVLRHTFATHLLNDGADMRDIQELLGHSSLAATQIYTHNSIGKLKEIYGKAHPRGKAPSHEAAKKD